MAQYELPVAGGRKLMIRPCVPGPRPQVQVAIISTRGNIVDAVNLEATDVLGLCRRLGQVARQANEQSAEAIRTEERDARRRNREALARNPWLHPDREARGLR